MLHLKKPSEIESTVRPVRQSTIETVDNNSSLTTTARVEAKKKKKLIRTAIAEIKK